MIPVVLDLDRAATGIEAARELPMREREQELRFACSMRALENFAQILDAALPAEHGTVLTGSGDFHHLSLPLIRRSVARHGPLDVVVLDNHPDNMRFPFGVHCGSWVRRVSELPGVQHVHVVGITSSDIGAAHAWENQWRPLRHGRLTYWSCGVDTGWASRFGMGRAFRNFEDMGTLLAAFDESLKHTNTPIYLSIDKDVLSAEDAHTNWDQGVMRESQMTALIQSLRGRIVDSDITGEVSSIRYQKFWKRWISALDSQPNIPEAQLAAWQAQQQALNLRLLATIEQSHDTRTTL